MAGGSRSRRRDKNHVASFVSSFEGWLVRQEHHLDELLTMEQHCDEARDDDLRDLINRTLSHYQQYYKEKSRIAHRDIFVLMSPTWFTSFERSFLWIAGFKPGLAFKIMNQAINDLTEQQRQRVSRVMEETRADEKTLNDEFAKAQESLAASPLLEVAKRSGRQREVEIPDEEDAISRLKTAMESMVASADFLRICTVVRMVEILTPVQNLKFLRAATAQDKKLGHADGSSQTGLKWHQVKEFRSSWPVGLRF